MRYVLWCIWFSLLVACPYYLVGGYNGPMLSSAYVWVALGLLSGVLCGCLREARAHLGGALPKAVLLLGVVATLVATVPELLCLSQYRFGVYEVRCWLTDQMPWESWQFGLLLLGALCCALTGLLRLRSRINDSREAASGENTQPVKRISEKGRRSATFLFPVMALLAGYAFRGIWLFVYPPSGNSHNPLFVQPNDIWWNFVPVAGVLALTLAVRWVFRRIPSGKTVSFFSVVGIAGYALGMMGYGAITRILPVYTNLTVLVSVLVAGALLLVLTAALTAASACGLRKPFVGANGDAPSGSTADGVSGAVDEMLGAADERPETADVHDCLLECGLAPRELEIAECTIAGLTSSQVALKLGIKSSSVRNALQRVYSKVDVSGREDFLAMFGKAGSSIGSLPVGDVRSSESLSDEGDRSESTVVCKSAVSQQHQAALLVVATASPIASFTILAVPHFTISGTWGIGRDVLYGLAGGLVIAGFFGIVFALARKLGLVESRHSEVSRLRLRFISCLTDAVFFAAGVVLLWCEMRFARLSIYLPATVFAAFLFGVFWLVFALDLIRIWLLLASGKKTFSMVLGAVCLVASSQALSYLSLPAWAIIGALSLLLGALGFDALAGSICLQGANGQLASTSKRQRVSFPTDEQPAQDSGVMSASTVVLAFFVSAVTGFSVEELWRNANGGAQGIAAALFLLAVVVCAIVALRYVIGGVSEGESDFCFDGKNTLAAVSGCALFAGFGCVAGEILLNKYYDTLTGNEVILSQWGGALSLAATESLVVGTLWITALAATVVLAKRAIDFAEWASLACGGTTLSAKRMRSYLSGRGLNETQVEVLLGILNGEASASIAERLCLSRGTVNTARNVGYKVLDVHSRVQLASKLHQVTNL